MLEGFKKTIIVITLLLLTISSTLVVLPTPVANASALTTGDMNSGDLGNWITGTVKQLGELGLIGVAAVPLLAIGTDIAAFNTIKSFAEAPTQFTSDREIKKGAFTLTRQDSCSFDEFCYKPDLPIVGGMPQGFYWGISINKETKKAKLALLILTPYKATTFVLDNESLWNNGFVANMKALDTYTSFPTPFEFVLADQNKAPAIYSTKKVIYGDGSKVDIFVNGRITFDDPPKNPKFFDSSGHVGLLYFGTADNALGMKTTSGLYDPASQSLVFEGANRIKVQNTDYLYTNETYEIHLWNANGYVNCTTGELQEAPTAGNQVPTSLCSEGYRSDLYFKLDEDGTIRVVPPVDPGNEANTGQKTHFALFGYTERTSPLGDALASAIKTIGSWIQATLGWVMRTIDSLLDETSNYVLGNMDGSSTGMRGPWIVMRNIGLSLLVMALIIIAFANVLQIDIEQYGMNRMIPKIIVSIMLAFFSWLIVTFFFDFTKAIQTQAIALLDPGASGGGSGLSFLGGLEITTPTAGGILADAGSVLLLLVILVGVIVCGVILLFTLLMRIIMLSFLLAVAPLAFILNIVPFTANLYKQWWSEFFKWMFMGPIALVILALGAIIASSASGGAFGQGGSVDSLTATGDGSTLLIGLIIFAAALYMAATLPMKWGGSIMKSWGGIGKKIWGATGGMAGKGIKMGAGAAVNRTGIPGAIKSGLDEFKKKGEMKDDAAANALLHSASGGRLGTDPGVYAQKLTDAQIKTSGDKIGVTSMSDDKLISSYANAKNPHERSAIEREAADRGIFEKIMAPEHIDPTTGTFYDDDHSHWGAGGKDAKDEAERNAKLAAGDYLASLGGQDAKLEKTVGEKQGEIFAAAGHSTSAPEYGQKLKGGFLAANSGKAGHEKRTQGAEFLEGKDAATFFNPNDIRQIAEKGDSKRQGKLAAHMNTLMASGQATKEQVDAYHESNWGSSAQSSGTGGSTQPSYSSGPASTSSTQAAEELRNKYK